MLHVATVDAENVGLIAECRSAYIGLPTIVAQCRWHGSATGRALDFAISRSQVQILLEATLRNNLGQVVYTYVPLSPSSITWYRPKLVSWSLTSLYSTNMAISETNGHSL